MSVYRFIISSLWYFRRQHIAVLAATILSTAVITGALIIGDSVKYSLLDMVDMRLGKTRFAMQTGERFVRAQIANDIGSKLNTSTAAIMMTRAIGVNPELNSRINNLQVLGVDEKFWELSGLSVPDLDDESAIISLNTSIKLGLEEGDFFLLRIENVDVIPLNTPLVGEKMSTLSIRLKVKEIVDENRMGRFSLRNNQAEPFNVFISRSLLCEKLELEDKANVILVAQNNKNDINRETLNNSLIETIKLTDYNLKINQPNKDESEIISNRIFIDKSVSDKIENLEYQSFGILTYLVNSIHNTIDTTPYSFVSAISNEMMSNPLKENEILINRWLSSDLKASVGDTLVLEYYVIGPLRRLEEEKKSFVIRDILPLDDSIFSGDLMPDFPGLADAGSCSDWNAGIPINLKRIRDKDEDYWDDHKGTPKAIISLNAGTSIWSNKFGELTSIRFDKDQLNPNELENEILSVLKPKDLNYSFLPVYEMGISGVNNSTDFSELFLSLSFFVIVSAILLLVLVYSLNTESRKVESGVLATIGFTKRKINFIRVGESLIIIIIGGIMGSLLGILYNSTIMVGLNSVWNDVVRTNMLTLHLKYDTLLIGALFGMFIALISIYFVSTRKLKNPINILIKDYSGTKYKAARKFGFNLLIAVVAFLGVIILLISSFGETSKINPGMFLFAGGLCLVGGISLFHRFITFSEGKTDVILSGQNQLAKKNMTRNRGRSMFTIALIAIGTFSIIITGANRKTFYGSENSRESGTGGFSFWVETSVPIPYNLNSVSGKSEIGLDDNSVNEVDFLQFFKLDGDDASCLNLNLAQQPRILGIDPTEFDVRNAFSFDATSDEVNKEHPWTVLNNNMGNNVIPAIADQTVLTWGLKKKVGDTIIIKNEQGQDLKLFIAGGLSSSIFQGNILISEKFFHEHFPSVGGTNVLLIDDPQNNGESFSGILKNQLQDYGIEINSTKSRLAEFNSVQNTYLSVFMILGVLGMIIGTIGLGIVLIRNIMERKSEIGLLLAIGFKKKEILQIIIKENLYLLISGIFIGIAAALIGILPSLISPAFSIPGLYIFWLIVIIFVSGFMWIYFPAKRIMKSNLISSLRSE